MSRVIVVGAGVAGLTAATRLARAGVNVTLLTKGLGGLQLSQGTLDILGYAPERVIRPFAAVSTLAATSRSHPYAAIGTDAVRTGVAFLRDVVGADLLAGDPEVNVFLPTAVGAVRPTALAQPSMLAGDVTSGARWAIVGLRRLKDFHPQLIAANLSRTPLLDGGRLTARPVSVDVPAREGEADSSGLAYARAFDDPSFRARFAADVQPLLHDDEIVGLPAVLGLKDLQAWKDVSRRLGHPVFEIPLPPPSVPGMRLNLALTAAARAAGVRIVLGSQVTGFRAQDGRLVSLTISAAGGPREFAGDAFVLAPGGFESGALAMDSYGTVTERILGLPLVGLDGELVHGDYWGADQPLFRAGVAVDAAMRVLDGSGSPVYSNLRAAGGILAGATRWAEKSGEGIAVGSAVAASDSILKELA